ncbi:hypothetical protein RABR111495_21885 [Rahnella bruchi]
MIKRRGEERTKVFANRTIVLNKKSFSGEKPEVEQRVRTFLQNEYSVRYTLML